MNKNKFKVLDLFCGAGGFSYGLDQVKGFETLLGVDFNKYAIETFKENFPKAETVCGNICDAEVKSKIIELSKDLKINMIIGGPPCQGFSLKGKNLGLDDHRNFLFLEYVEIVEKLLPNILIIENVKNLINSGEGYFINQIYKRFTEIGYTLNYGILNSVNFGVPQKRERAIIIGTLNSSGISLPEIYSINQVTVRDAISDLSYLNSGEGKDKSNYINPPQSEYQKKMRKNSKYLYNHKATSHSKETLKKLSLIPSEGDKSYLPLELHGKQQFSTTWARLIWDEPSPTIDTRFDTPSNGKNTHPFLNRAITPREAARIQSFPDDFIFKGTKTSICTQIGNAVPPLMAKAIGEHIMRSLEERSAISNDDI